ncbi:MAG TPA: FtsX-like permease family protein [Segeticoccus sp.]|uniref:ABC transporter permease n=1 Tax=Segeticoccus sp. TaxID=2706531 RepID=UPI002D80E7D4|nr:FtsX-like permease family protein [Segeticoccus sp.]HET8600491.1 FtsX-like permease family protein [Segeticoccus sp.]
MLRATWRSLLGRKLRLLMSAVAIVLGVAFVAGSLVFTDTLSRAYTSIMAGTVGDVVVRPAGSTGDDNAQLDRTLSAALVSRLAKVDGAARADGNVTAYGVFPVGRDGKVVGVQGAPGIAVNYHDAPAGHGVDALTLRRGHVPQQRGQVALDSTTAEKSGYRLGQQIRLVTSGGQASTTATLVGIVGFSNGGGLGGASLAVFDTHTAQQLFEGGQDVFTDAWVTADQGVSQAELRDRVASVLPAGYEAVTGDTAADEAASDINQGLSFINTFLLVFAGIALVVGSFLIVNTFSILVAQRSRELALLRALGASRRQVSRSVILEAFVVGLVGSTLGLGLGLGLAAGIKALFTRLGMDVSGTALVLAPRTVLAAYAVGVVVTVVAAYLPARRASRIAPVEAMRDDVALPESSIRRRVLIGGSLLVVGVTAVLVGLFAGVSHGTVVMGGGMLLVLLGVALAAPVIGRPVVAVLGGLQRRLFGTVGRLAEQNSRRNPRRTAATASALMIGLTLVSAMSVIGASASSSVDKLIKDGLAADYVVSNVVGSPFSPSIATELAAVDGVRSVAELRMAPATLGGKQTQVMAVGRTFPDMVDLPVLSGSVDHFTGHALLLGKDKAASLGVHVGETVPVQVADQRLPLRVVAILDDNPLTGDTVTTLSALTDLGVKPADFAAFVLRAPSADAAQVHHAVDAVVKDIPTVTVQDQAEFAQQQRGSIDQLLTIIYALLALAVVIAILGIVNTLSLSVIERTREVGLLRAVGLSRRQVRRMVRLEAVVIALLGAVLGVVLGLGFGIALQHSQVENGVAVLTVPWARLAVFVVLAGVVGVLAAWWPARRAARLDVLRAITTD